MLHWVAVVPAAAVAVTCGAAELESAAAKVQAAEIAWTKADPEMAGKVSHYELLSAVKAQKAEINPPSIRSTWVLAGQVISALELELVEKQSALSCLV